MFGDAQGARRKLPVAMTSALQSAVATLPEPIHSAHVNIIAESILRTARAGERDMAILQRRLWNCN